MLCWSLMVELAAWAGRGHQAGANSGGDQVLLFFGVDSHKDSLAACLVDQTGAQLAVATFPNTPDGHGDLLGLGGDVLAQPGRHGSYATKAWTSARCPAH